MEKKNYSLKDKELPKIKEAISLAKGAYHHGMISLHEFIEEYNNGAEIKGYLIKIEKIMGDKNSHVNTRTFGFDSCLEKEIEESLIKSLRKK